jgi:hypothetical protein
VAVLSEKEDPLGMNRMALRRRFGRQLRIIVRGDSGFTREPTMAFCEERKHVYYCLGLAKNTPLKALLEPPMKTVREQFEGEASTVGKRRYEDFEYRTLKSWSRTRPVIGKAELLANGDSCDYGSLPSPT